MLLKQAEGLSVELATHWARLFSQGRYTHYSESTGTEMAFSVFVPAIDELDDDSGV